MQVRFLPNELKIMKTLKHKEMQYALAELIAGCETTKDVAGRLLMLGCKGSKSIVRCPIAVYLKRHVLLDIRVNGHNAYYIGHGIVELPRLIKDFIKEFDNRQWEDLNDSLNENLSCFFWPAWITSGFK